MTRYDKAPSRNVAKLVERPEHSKHEMRTWTAGQAGAFLDAVADHRLSAAWQLSLYGLRRGEVLGLCWSDIDFQTKTITIQRARVEVTGAGVVEVGPKTERGKRTLPMDAAWWPLCAHSKPNRLASVWRLGRPIPWLWRLWGSARRGERTGRVL